MKNAYGTIQKVEGVFPSQILCLFKGEEGACKPVDGRLQMATSNLQQSWGAEVSKRERDYRKE